MDTGLLIGGEWRDGGDADRITVLNPATGEEITTVAAGEAMIDQATRGTVSDLAAPFGGMKQSGLSREGAREGIYEFYETQYIATRW